MRYSCPFPLEPARIRCAIAFVRRYNETDAAPHLGALLGRRGGCWKEAVQQGVQEEVPEVPEDLPRAAVALALAAAALAALAAAAAVAAPASAVAAQPFAAATASAVGAALA